MLKTASSEEHVMSRRSVTLEIPDDLYEKVQQVAQASERSPEAILLESLDVLFQQPSATASIDRLLSELPHYSDTQLWAVVNRQLPWPQTLRLRELSGCGKQGALAEKEQTELNGLIDQVDRYMLLRSEALTLLQQRGHEINSYLKLGA
jgi:hypothetical protein